MRDKSGFPPGGRATRAAYPTFRGRSGSRSRWPPRSRPYPRFPSNKEESRARNYIRRSLAPSQPNSIVPRAVDEITSATRHEGAPPCGQVAHESRFGAVHGACGRIYFDESDDDDDQGPHGGGRVGRSPQRHAHLRRDRRLRRQRHRGYRGDQQHGRRPLRVQLVAKGNVPRSEPSADSGGRDDKIPVGESLRQ